MRHELHNLQRNVKPAVARGANDVRGAPCNALQMARTTRIHTDKRPMRIHFIKEWAEHRHLRPADLVEATGADKSTVSRWFSGKLPTDKHLLALAELYQVDVPSLFRDPHDDWMVEFFQNRNLEEIKRIRAMVEAAFPKKVARDATG